MPAFGVYPVANAIAAGNEISSTYEGRHITLLESEVVHPSHTDGFADHGDPVVFGTTALKGVGVVVGRSATAATDKIVIDTEGIWTLDVNAADDGGSVAVEGGDPLYINITTGVISKIADASTNIPFGYALGHIDAGSTEAIAVKVHFDPVDNWILDVEALYFGDGKDVGMAWDGTNFVITQAGGRNTLNVAVAAGAIDDGYGVHEVNLNATGVWTGFGAAASAWANLASGCTIAAENYICARNDGVYEDAGGVITNAKVIFGARMQAILGDTDGLVFPWSINTNNTAITALIDVNNLIDLGMVGNAGTALNYLVPLMRDAGGTIKYVKLYDLQ